MAGAARILGIAYPSCYVPDLPAARAFCERVFGPAGHEEEGISGFRVGDTWLTLLDGRYGPPPPPGTCRGEFGLRMASPADVDAFHARAAESGAVTVMAPRDTKMYELMRYACVDLPFGLRLSVFCPLP
jgi:catechol 2,3-dioxygenase-like lactoylglutathione lyase family enzyme